jgi:hypothetical protein
MHLRRRRIEVQASFRAVQETAQEMQKMLAVIMEAAREFGIYKKISSARLKIEDLTAIKHSVRRKTFDELA